MAKQREDADDFQDRAEQQPPAEVGPAPLNSFEAAVARMGELADKRPEELEPAAQNQEPPPDPPLPDVGPVQLPQEGPQTPTQEVAALGMEDLVKSMERLSQSPRQPQHRQQKADQADANQAQAELLAQPPVDPVPPPDPPAAETQPLPGENFAAFARRMEDLRRTAPPRKSGDPPRPNPFKGIPNLDSEDENVADAEMDGGLDSARAALVDAKRTSQRSEIAFLRALTEIELEHSRQIDDLIRALESGRVS